MHTLRFTVTQVLIKLTFKQPVNVAASCTVQGFIKLLIQQQDRGPVVEAFCMSRGCLLIRCGLQEPMREPVIAADGQTYEKAALKSWLQQHDTSPVTGQPFFFFFWVGELFITHTWTCNERNHKCQTEGHPQPKLQATLTTWVEADTKVCKEATCQAKQAAHKAVVHQPTAKPVHFQQTKHHLCLNQLNIAVKITSYNEVPSKASSRQDSCSPSICQARFISLDKRQAHA